MRQFYLATDPDQLPQPGEQVTLDSDESHHLFTVLRGGRETELELVDGRGHRMTALPRGKEGKLALVEIISLTTDEEEFREPRLTLACAVVKGKRFEWALEKAVELGVHDFLPLETDLGVIDPGPGKRERWRTIMTAALKQSGRSWLPSLEDPRSLADVLSRGSTGPVYFGAAPRDAAELQGGVPFWTEVLERKVGDSPALLTVLIGPEGGWSPGELSQLATAGALPFSMGPHILRTETAALAGLAVLQALRDQWRPGRS